MGCEPVEKRGEGVKGTAAMTGGMMATAAAEKAEQVGAGRRTGGASGTEAGVLFMSGGERAAVDLLAAIYGKLVAVSESTYSHVRFLCNELSSVLRLQLHFQILQILQTQCKAGPQLQCCSVHAWSV